MIMFGILGCTLVGTSKHLLRMAGNGKRFDAFDAVLGILLEEEKKHKLTES